jgi:hypothetical protein
MTGESMRTRAKQWIWIGVLLRAIALVTTVSIAQDDPPPWAVWQGLDISALGDDNSGSTFARSDAVTTEAGEAALEVMPGGTSDETKLAIPLTGADLVDWTIHEQIALDMYLPEGNALHPNRFFLGMADVTGGEFNWIGGVFGESEVQPGWNRITYTLIPAMQAIDPDAQYALFLSFFNETNGAKAPLTEPIYLGAAYLTSASGSALRTGDADSAVLEAEVDLLLGLDDAALLDAVARETFDYFWSEANPENGLIRDRSTPDSVSSIAAVGFGLAAIPLAVDRGWIPYDQGYERALTTLQTFANGGVQGEGGFFYHFVDMDTGERMWGSEVSSIDTTLLIAGALVAGEYFADTEVETLANQLYERIDWQWMMSNNENLVSMGWNPETGFLTAFWDHFDESVLLYVLGIGSPTHPVPVEAWDEYERPVNVAGEYIYLPGEPLFVYQYPQAFLNLRGLVDAYANYWNNTVRACQRNREFAAENADRRSTYQDGVWGISASDGPQGYRAYGAAGGNHDGTIAPYAAIACLPFTPDESIAAIRAMLEKYRARVWGEYGFVSAINEDAEWYSTDHIGIDQGDILLMIANYQDGSVWDLFMQNEYVQTALDAMGFVPSEGDYAVTPDHLAEVRGD